MIERYRIPKITGELPPRPKPLEALAGEIITRNGGTPQGDLRKGWRCRCPAHGGDNPTAFSVRLVGNQLRFKCFAECGYDAIRNILRRDGLWPGATGLEGTAASSDAEEKRSIAQRRTYATSIWEELTTRESERQLNYLLERYMEPRGLSVPATALIHCPLRWSPDGTDPADVLTGDDPAMVLPIRDKTGQLQGIQATWLEWTFTTKRELEPKRQTYGLLKGNFIELVKTDYARETPLVWPLIIGEGVETVLSAMTLTGLPGIATGGTVANVDPPRKAEYIILVDCDDKGVSREAAGRLARKLLGGKNPPVVRLATPLRPEGGKSGYDWNDALVEAGAAAEKIAGLRTAILDAPEFETVKTDTEKREDDLNALVELKAADPFAYEQKRKRKAKELNINPGGLDREIARRAALQEPATDDDGYLKQVEPWPEPVDGFELLDKIQDVLAAHVVLSERQYLAAALWVLHSYTYDAADNSPILDVSSPTMRCGKTQLLETMGMLVSKALPAANITSALVFRVIDKYRPTLIIDEMDSFLSGKDELRGILNSGFNRRSAQVPRCVGDDNEPKFFSTWSPKIFSHIGRIPPTLEDRAIKIGLRRKMKDDKVERLPRGDPYVDIRQKCARWAADNFETLAAADPKIPESLNDREADSWRPLLAIADLCDVGKTAREGAEGLSETTADETVVIVLLEDLAYLFDTRKAEDSSAVSMTSAEIVAALAEMEDRSWPEYRNGKSITPAQLAALLKPFKISPRKVKGRDRVKQALGYRFDLFEKTFLRYLEEKAPFPTFPKRDQLVSTKNRPP